MVLIPSTAKMTVIYKMMVIYQCEVRMECSGCKGIIFGFILGFITILGCKSSVEPSPQPGVLRLYLTTNPADTLTIVGPDTVRIHSGDEFFLTITQMKVYHNDSLYAVVFDTLMGYQEKLNHYNVLQRESGNYTIHKTGETYLPPQHYTKIQFVVYPATAIYIGGRFFPIQLSSDYDPLITLDYAFRIEQNKTTAVTIQFNFLKSFRRWRDSYYFEPNFEILP